MVNNSPSPETAVLPEEVNLLDYLAVIFKRLRMISSLCLSAVILSVFISLRLPSIFKATATIMPPSNSGREALSALASKMGGMEGLLGFSSSNSDLYVEMLKSRTIRDVIIDKFGLIDKYKVTLRNSARQKLKSNTKILISKADTVVIGVEDEDPQLAADIANTYIEELDKLTRRISLSDASRRRKFLEKRIEFTKKQLADAEKELKEFQEKNKIVSLKTQASSSIYGASQIQMEILKTETELDVLKSFVTGNSNKMLRLERKLGKLKEQRDKIETGQTSGHMNDSEGEEDNFYLPFSQMPELELYLSRLIRKVKIKETVYELLTQQYELAKIAESKNSMTIQVLDKAVAPEVRSRPNRRVIVILTTLISFFVSIFLALILEYIEKLQLNDQARLTALKAAFKGSLPFSKEAD